MKMSTPFVLFDDAQMQADARLYTAPLRILSCSNPKDVGETLAQIDQVLKDGFHVAGYLAYELGYLLEDKLAPLIDTAQEQPLIWMGVFKEAQTLSPEQVTQLMAVLMTGAE